MSAKTMWSGTITLGLLSIPVTVGKSWSEERERGLKDLCAVHHEPVDRSERCNHDIGLPGGAKGRCGLSGGKVKGVETEDGWRTLEGSEYDRIEEATKSDTLEILDVQHAYDLPLDFVIGTYWVRHNAKAKGARPDAFAHFVEALGRDDKAAIVKWCKSTRQTLAILHTDAKGHLLMSAIPYANEIRPAGSAEEEHLKVEISDEIVDQMRELLGTVASDEFDHSAYSDEGVRLRSEAIEKILNAEDEGQEEQEEKNDEGNSVPDLMAALRASIEQTNATKEKAKS